MTGHEQELRRLENREARRLERAEKMPYEHFEKRLSGRTERLDEMDRDTSGYSASLRFAAGWPKDGSS